MVELPTATMRKGEPVADFKVGPTIAFRATVYGSTDRGHVNVSDQLLARLVGKNVLVQVYEIVEPK